MEVNINKDVREYTESVFFGLNIRQLVCSGFAVAAAVGVYFVCKEQFTKQFVTYACIAAALPFALMAFVKYNGMTMEKFIVEFVKDRFIVPQRMTFSSNNLYYEGLKDTLENKKKENINAKKRRNNIEAG